MAVATNQPQTPDLAPDPITPDNPEGSGVDLQPASNNKLDVKTTPTDSDASGPPRQFHDDKRAAIYAKARESRKASMQDFSGDPTDPAALYGNLNNLDDLGDLEREALERQKQVREQGTQPPQTQDQPPAAPPPKPLNGLDPQLLSQRVTAIIDGQPQDISIEDAIRAFQMNSAADKRFTQANQILQQVKELQRGAAYQPPNDGQNDDDEQDYNGTATSEGRPGTTGQAANFDARALAEKIQLGSTEEAAEAIGSLIEAVKSNQAPVDHTIQTLAVLEDRTSTEALQRYASENPDLQDEIMQDLTAKYIQRAMVDDLIASGMSADQLRKMVRNPQELTNLHKLARIQQAPGVRSTLDLVKAGHSQARAWRGQTTAAPRPGQPTMAQRNERKASLPTQPASRGNAATAIPQRPVSQEQRRSDAVAQMRKARGQPA